jgi:hypothetical protein
MTEYTHTELATKRRELAQEYNRDMKELAELKKDKAFELIKLMVEHKTKAKAEVYYDATENGQKEIMLTYKCRGLLELIRSMKQEIEIKNAEAFGSY